VTRAEWIEAALIAGIAVTTTMVWPYLPADVTLSQLILGSAVLLLTQSLVRDVAILLRQRAANTVSPARVANCMCIESTIGAVGVVVGLSAPAIFSAGILSLGRIGFSLAVVGTLAFGLAIKDWVIAWNPLALRREKDHLNVIVRWKR